MLLHHGQIIEKVVRRNGHSISDVARLINVNRRSVYNWFTQQQLKPEIIFRIGCIIHHDFSIEFPKLFTTEEFVKGFTKTSFLDNTPEERDDLYSEDNWKNKYIDLLERYTAWLSRNGAV